MLDPRLLQLLGQRTTDDRLGGFSNTAQMGFHSRPTDASVFAQGELARQEMEQWRNDRYRKEFIENLLAQFKRELGQQQDRQFGKPFNVRPAERSKIGKA